MSYPSISRRAALQRLGLAAVAAAAGARVTAPVAASAQAPPPPIGQPEPVDQALKRVFGGRPMKDGSGVIKLDMPNIAENGATVPISVEVSSPMTPANYVKHIYVVADKNRVPIVTRAVLTPDAGQAYIGENIRLGENGIVRVIAEQSDGTLFELKREVRVTVSGCAF